MIYRILTLIKSLGLGGAERLLVDRAPEVLTWKHAANPFGPPYGLVGQ